MLSNNADETRDKVYDEVEGSRDVKWMLSMGSARFSAAAIFTVPRIIASAICTNGNT